MRWPALFNGFASVIKTISFKREIHTSNSLRCSAAFFCCVISWIAPYIRTISSSEFLTARPIHLTHISRFFAVIISNSLSWGIPLLIQTEKKFSILTLDRALKTRNAYSIETLTLGGISWIAATSSDHINLLSIKLKDQPPKFLKEPAIWSKDSLLRSCSMASDNCSLRRLSSS